MQCNICGRAISKGQVAYDTKSEQIGGADWGGAYTKTVQIALCPDCVRQRNSAEACLWIALVGAIGTSLVALVLGLDW
jgi:hypothetical protein